jgi:NADH-quinone oxidoreductase subunit M
MHTRRIDAYNGLINRMPWYALAFMVFTLANVGLPGTSGFVGEFLALVGAFRVNTLVAILATTGVVLSAAYALWLYRRIIFGRIEMESLRGIIDMGPREKAILIPLIALTILFGVYPAPLLDVTAASVDNLINQYQAALTGAARTAALAP